MASTIILSFSDYSFEAGVTLNLGLIFSWLGWKLASPSHLPISILSERGYRNVLDAWIISCAFWQLTFGPHDYAAKGFNN